MSPPVETTVHTASQSLRVLVVEDNALNQELILQMLAKLGHRMVGARDGVEGLALFKAQTFDLVIMDVRMPVMDGLTCTKFIREYEKTKGAKRVPIVALTADAMPSVNQRCIEAGMDRFHTKPLTFAQLAAVVHELTE